MRRFWACDWAAFLLAFLAWVRRSSGRAYPGAPVALAAWSRACRADARLNESIGPPGLDGSQPPPPDPPARESRHSRRSPLPHGRLRCLDGVEVVPAIICLLAETPV